MNKLKSKTGTVDIAKLKRTHPNDPRIGQGYNDARGEIEDLEDPFHPIPIPNLPELNPPSRKSTP